MSDTTPIAQQVKAAYRRYITGYPAALYRWLTTGETIDYDALGFWAFPMLFITGGPDGTAVNVVDQPLFDRQVRALYTGYHADGWGGRIELDAADVTIVSAKIALIETAGTRYRPDGSILNRWEACYWMRATTAGWKHFAVTDTEPPRPSPSQWTAWLTELARI